MCTGQQRNQLGGRKASCVITFFFLLGSFLFQPAYAAPIGTAFNYQGYLQSESAPASLEGAFLDVKINAINQMEVTRRDQDGVKQDRECVVFNAPYYVAASQTVGYGWSDKPWPDVSDAAKAASDATRYPDCEEKRIDINVDAGRYPGRVVFKSKFRVKAIGGNAIIAR